MATYGHIPDGFAPGTFRCSQDYHRTPTKPGTVSTTTVFGVKELVNCKETWHSAYLHNREPKLFDRCLAGVVNVGRVVHPSTEFDHGSPDLRCDHLRVLSMWSQEDGTPCVFGSSQIYPKEYRVGESYKLSDQDFCTDVFKTCRPGFHFWVSCWAAGPSHNKK